MRLQFNLKKVIIDPVCHIQIVRHAEEYQNRYASGQIYGALYDDMAEITNVMPFPDKLVRQELQAMERKHDDNLVSYSLDSDKLGWYMICYKRNFWDQLESMRYYEKYIDTSFLLVFDDKSKIQGKNPYKAYRLKDDFAEKQHFRWCDLQKSDIQEDNPFIQILVQVSKNDLFQFLMLQNKQYLLQSLYKNKQYQKEKQIKQNIQQYMQSFDEQLQLKKSLNDLYIQQGSEQNEKLQSKNILFADYARILAQNLQLANYHKYFQQYEDKVKNYSNIFKRNQ